MGLDFLARALLTREEQEQMVHECCQEQLDAGKTMDWLIEKKIGKYARPCILVNAPRLKDAPDFRQRVEKYVNSRKDWALKAQREGADPRDGFVNRWLKRTVEEQMVEDGDKFDCERCPLLIALNGNDARGNPFLGITVSTCSFRGKRISSDDVLEDLAHEAFEDRTPEEMIDYADRLEAMLPGLREQGLLTDDPYEVYVKEFPDSFEGINKETMLTKEQYEALPNWREQNIKEAVSWLRTCASFGCHLEADY